MELCVYRLPGEVAFRVALAHEVDLAAVAEAYFVPLPEEVEAVAF